MDAWNLIKKLLPAGNLSGVLVIVSAFSLFTLLSGLVEFAHFIKLLTDYWGEIWAWGFENVLFFLDVKFSKDHGNTISALILIITVILKSYSYTSKLEYKLNPITRFEKLSCYIFLPPILLIFSITLTNSVRYTHLDNVTPLHIINILVFTSVFLAPILSIKNALSNNRQFLKGINFEISMVRSGSQIGFLLFVIFIANLVSMAVERMADIIGY